MTPTARLNINYWLGTCQAIVSISAFNTHLSEYDIPGMVFYGLLGALWILIIFLYIKNCNNFSKETLWMTIKNPAKVTREADDLKVATTPNGAQSSNRPPTVPRPNKQKPKFASVTEVKDTFRHGLPKRPPTGH